MYGNRGFGGGHFPQQNWAFSGQPIPRHPIHNEHFVSQQGFRFNHPNYNQLPAWKPIAQAPIHLVVPSSNHGHRPVPSSNHSNPTYTNNMNNNHYNNRSHHQMQWPAATSLKNNKRGHTGPHRTELQHHTSGPDKKRRKTKEDEEDDNVPPETQLIIEDVPVPSSKQSSQNAKITEAIWRYFVSHKQSDSAYKQKVDLRDALYAIFADVFPYCGLYMVGSSMSGFATRTSDMDLCLMISRQEIEPKREAVEILLAIQKALKKLRFIKRIMLIRARVPILKFQDFDGHIECDLNINNSVGIRNTHLLRYYASMDWRVRPLVLFMKKWARFHDINDASKKTISSYSFCLMMIHYLQAACNPPVLDSVQKLYPTLFDYGEDIRNLQMNTPIQFKSKNSQSIGDLFLGFLKYYSYEFDFERDVASVRQGTRLPIHIVTARCQPQDIRSWGCLKVEEPFDMTNTARSCFDVDTFSRVKRVFSKSYRELSKKRSTEAILSTPF